MLTVSALIYDIRHAVLCMGDEAWTIMKISGPGKIESTTVRRKNGASASNAAGFALDQADDTGGGGAKPVAGSGPVSVVGALLSIQEVDEQGGGQRETLNRADEMLNLLDDVRHGLLMGALPEAKLRRLLILSNIKRDGFLDPRLAGILSDIELRAKVELAKLEMSQVKR